MKLTLILTLVATMFLSSCASDENKNTEKGVGIGAAAGALIGGVVGNQQGKGKEGAILGAVLGGAVGGHMGHRMDVQAKELKQIAETKRTDQGLITKMKSDILFDTGKADLKPAAQDNLKKMADIMKKYPEDVLTIKGYTDGTGSTGLNETLSKKRADAVKGTLVAGGLPESTISTKGMGPAEPIGDNKTADGRKQNRRVEIEVTVDESKVPKK